MDRVATFGFDFPSATQFTSQPAALGNLDTSDHILAKYINALSKILNKINYNSIFFAQISQHNILALYGRIHIAVWVRVQHVSVDFDLK